MRQFRIAKKISKYFGKAIDKNLVEANNRNIILNYIKDFLLGFLLAWYATDLWKLFKGDMSPLWRKGITIEWLVNTKQEEGATTGNNLQEERLTYAGFRVSYTYSEPILIKKVE